MGREITFAGTGRGSCCAHSWHGDRNDSRGGAYAECWASGDRAEGPHEASLFDIDAKYADVVETNDVLAYLRDLVIGAPSVHEAIIRSDQMQGLVAKQRAAAIGGGPGQRRSTPTAH